MQWRILEEWLEGVQFDQSRPAMARLYKGGEGRQNRPMLSGPDMAMKNYMLDGRESYRSQLWDRLLSIYGHYEAYCISFHPTQTPLARDGIPPLLPTAGCP